MEEQIQLFFKSASPKEVKPFLNSLVCQNYESFEQFTDFLGRCQPKSSCGANWTTRTMISRCKNCGSFENSCICLPCLLNGDHIQENHEIYLYYGSCGTCDCGHSEDWDKRGFCKNHHGQCEHPEKELPPELCSHLTTIFEVLKKFVIQEIESKTFHFFNEIFEFIIQLSEMGDGIRRLASISFSEETIVKTILTNCYIFSSKEAQTMKSFISSYSVDDLFSQNFGKLLFQYCPSIYEKSLNLCHVQFNASNESPLVGPITILSLMFHFYIQLAKGENGLNFNDFYSKTIEISFDFIKSNPSLFEGRNSNGFFHNFWCIKIIVQYYLKENMKEEIKQLFIMIASSFSKIEGYVPPLQTLNIFDDDSSYYDYRLSYDLMEKFYPLLFNLAKKMDYISEIIEIFINFLYQNDNLDHPSFLFLIHKLAIATLKNAKNAKEEFDKIIRKHELFSIFDEKIKNKEEGFANYKNVYELIYFRACLIPINMISLSMLVDFKLLNNDEYPKSFQSAINLYNHAYYAHIDVPFFLSMIQLMFSFMEDKNSFLKLVESKFNIFDPKNSQSKTERMFCFILIVSYLIFNDPKFIGKKKKIIQLMFMTLLKNDPESEKYNWNFYCGVIELNRALKWYKEVKFENSWHIIVPFISPKYLLKEILPDILKEMSVNSKNNNSILLPFPDFIDSEIIDLRSLMKSTYLYAILYDIMYDSKNSLLYHYALNLFILLYNNERPIKETKNEKCQINAITIDEIVNQIPLNFIEFCNIKINYKRGGSYLSLIDLIENSGSIGLNALNRTVHKKSKKLKSNIKNIKEKIISNYKRNALKFNYSKVENLITDIKIKPNDKIFIFTNLSVLTIPDFLETQYHFDFRIKKEESEEEDDNEIENNKLLSSFMKKRNHLKNCITANTCGHYSNNTSNNICPHCGLICNFFLPNFIATNNQEIYSDHITTISSILGDMKLWVKLLKNMIIILDFRSRLKPEVVQDEITFLLYKNLFLLVKNLSNKINPSLFFNKKSKLGIFLYDFIFTNECDSTNFVSNFFLNYVQKFNYIIDYEFLKRIELIRLYFINQNLETIIDVDDHFSFKNLIEMYKIPENFIEPTKYTKYQYYQSIHDTVDLSKIEKNKIGFDINEEQLPAFRGINLPDNFLQIINHPFDIKIELKNGEEKLICLATGEIVNRNYTRRHMQIPRELSCQPVLIADGFRVNTTGIWRVNCFLSCKSIYRNRKGNENVGFENGDPVFLDHELYINLMDDFISGKCVRNIDGEKYELI